MRGPRVCSRTCRLPPRYPELGELVPRPLELADAGHETDERGKPGDRQRDRDEEDSPVADHRSTSPSGDPVAAACVMRRAATKPATSARARARTMTVVSITPASMTGIVRAS